MTAKMIATMLVERTFTAAAEATLAAGIDSDSVVAEFYYAEPTETPEATVQDAIEAYELQVEWIHRRGGI